MHDRFNGSDKTYVWTLNAILAAVAVLLAGVAGLAFIATKSPWVIVGFFVLMLVLGLVQSYVVYRITR